MRCPKDAYNTEEEDWCSNLFVDKTGNNWECSRPKGHKGMHHAHFMNEEHCDNRIWSTPNKTKKKKR